MAEGKVEDEIKLANELTSKQRDYPGLWGESNVIIKVPKVGEQGREVRVI